MSNYLFQIALLFIIVLPLNAQNVDLPVGDIEFQDAVLWSTNELRADWSYGKPTVVRLDNSVNIMPGSDMYVLKIELRGGDGGTAKLGNHSGDDCRTYGGEAATVTASFPFNTSHPNAIQPDGVLILTPGSAGYNYDSSAGFVDPTAGGSATSVAYTRVSDWASLDPRDFSTDMADADTKWVLLAVAGGGGGAFAEEVFWNCVNQHTGKGAPASEEGTDGGGSAFPTTCFRQDGDGGENGGGGVATSGSSGASIYPGAGAYDNGYKTFCGNTWSDTEQGAGRRGNVHGNYYEHWDDKAGGFATGGGLVIGATLEWSANSQLGGGGGGGYSGGGAGIYVFGGGGGGSFVNAAAFEQEVIAGGNGAGREVDGYVKYVHAKDTEAPTLNCNDDVFVYINDDLNSFDFATDFNMVDNASGPADIVLVTDDADLYNMDCSDLLSVITLTFTATDLGGNEASPCTTTILPVDQPLPLCCGEPTTNCTNFSRTVTVNGGETVTIDPHSIGGGTAGCGVASEVLDLPAVTCDDVGLHQVLYTITDNYGRSASCTGYFNVMYMRCEDVEIDIMPGESYDLSPAELADQGCDNNNTPQGDNEYFNCIDFLQEYGFSAAPTAAEPAHYVSVPHHAGWEMMRDEDFTVEFYYYPVPSSVTSPTGEYTLMGKSSLDGTRQPFTLYMDANRSLSLRRRTDYGSADRNDIFTLPENEWSHITVHKSGTSLRVLINGEVEDEWYDGATTTIYSFVHNDSPFQLGNDGTGTAVTAAGYYDELRIWDHARSMAGLETYTEVGLRGDEAGLLTYLTFEDHTEEAEDYGPAATHGRYVRGTRSNAVASPIGNGATLRRLMNVSAPGFCQSTVTVRMVGLTDADQSTPPLVSCGTATVAVPIDGSIDVSTLGLANIRQEGCGDSYTETYSPAVLDCGDLGEQSVQYTLTDEAGNEFNCVHTITVQLDGDCLNETTFEFAGQGEEVFDAASVLTGNACVGGGELTGSTVTIGCGDFSNDHALTIGGSNITGLFSYNAAVSFDNQDPFTVEFWFKPEATQHSSTEFGTIMGLNDGNSGPYPWVIGMNDDFTIELRRKNSLEQLVSVRATATPLTPGQWHHVVVTKPDATLRIYVDGVRSLLGADPLHNAPGTVNDDGNLKVGRLTGHSGQFASGDIDELRVWADFRTEAELNTYRYLGLRGDEEGLLVYAPFEEGSGATRLKDYGPYNIGSLALGVSWTAGEAAPVSEEMIVREVVIDGVFTSGSCESEVLIRRSASNSCEQILPIDLLSFTGDTRDKDNRLYWTTMREEAFSHFEVERSASGIDFEVLGAVAGAGEGSGSEEIATYQFTDVDPFVTAYYRLRMVDLDGSHTYSKVVKLEREVAALLVYPNPNDGRFTVQLPPAAAETAELTLYDAAGRVLKQVTAVSDVYAFSLDLVPGIYVLVADLPEGRVMRRMVVR